MQGDLDILEAIKHALGLDVMWKQTVVTPVGEDGRIFDALEEAGVEGLRIKAHSAVDEGTVLIINDEAMDAAIAGWRLDIAPPSYLSVADRLALDAYFTEQIARGACKITNVA